MRVDRLSGGILEEPPELAEEVGRFWVRRVRRTRGGGGGGENQGGGPRVEGLEVLA